VILLKHIYILLLQHLFLTWMITSEVMIERYQSFLLTELSPLQESKVALYQ